MSTFLMILIWLLFGALNAWYASYKGRDPFIWFFLGIFLGILGLIILFFLPNVVATPPTSDRASDGNDNPEPSTEKPMVELLPAPPSIPYPEQKEWFYLDSKNVQQGPVSLSLLKEEWKKGEVNEDTFVWSEDFDKWYQIKELPNLLQML